MSAAALDGFTDVSAAADNPLLEHLAIRLVEIAAGRASFELDVQPRHLNRQRKLQGGVVATLLDAACGYAGLAAADGDALGHAVTVTLNINYLMSAGEGLLRATGRVTRRGRSLYFAGGELVDSSGQLIATAQGAFKRSVQSTEA
jgi:uncharacterized protein (TIGR00369 family)